jgi:dTDP-4-dehydrorhamnose 3,5-epimerase
MKIVAVRELELPGVKTVRFERFCDSRGYFSEVFRKSDMNKEVEIEIVQINESVSHSGVIRGLHFQWNPFMGKFVRTIKGHMVDLILDIRIGSPTYGKIIAHDMPVALELPSDPEWIWVPPGFAHGNYFKKDDTIIEYLCTGEYSNGDEAGISPIADDLDWSMCNTFLRDEFKGIVDTGCIMSDKDRNGLTLEQWSKRKESELFVYEEK